MCYLLGLSRGTDWVIAAIRWIVFQTLGLWCMFLWSKYIHSQELLIFWCTLHGLLIEFCSFLYVPLLHSLARTVLFRPSRSFIYSFIHLSIYLLLQIMIIVANGLLLLQITVANNYWAYIVCQALSRRFKWINSFTPHYKYMRQNFYYHHFTDEQTEVLWIK